MVTPDSILAFCMEHLEGVVLRESWGERGIYYNPGETLPRGVYILTIKEKDGENDRASQLDREGVYRVNLGLRKPSFRALFGELPKRPPAGGVVEMPYDFAALDRLIPHPVYAWMGWIAVLSPGEQTFRELLPYIEEAYVFAKEKYNRRKRK